MSREVLAELERRLRAHAGLELPGWVLEARATSRMNALGLGEREYLARVGSGGATNEIEELVEAVRVGETRFFRHRAHIDALVEVVVPSWQKRHKKSPRVWSAGCATGEEPYTLALVLSRAIRGAAHTPSILATDVSAEAIAIGQRGIYPKAAMEAVPAKFRDGFEADGESVRLKPSIASLVTFERRNLTDSAQPRGFDLVWCRNVLIYFSPAARQRVLDKLVMALDKGGFLFVGPSESLRDVPGLRALTAGEHIVWEKIADGDASRDRPSFVGPRSRASGLPGDSVQRISRISAIPSSRTPVSSVPVSAAPSSPTRTPRLSAARERAATVLVTGGDAAAISAQISEALRARGLEELTIDLDGAAFLGDDIAPILRRAAALASAGGIRIAIASARSGTRRWLRRHGFAGGDP